ncbi:MAG: hypothetical protein QOJ32_2180, partial [Frankiaceae bacterium]|nr:hypothetical protein [Frankiaceae bacterium]
MQPPGGGSAVPVSPVNVAEAITLAHHE